MSGSLEKLYYIRYLCENCNSWSPNLFILPPCHHVILSTCQIANLWALKFLSLSFDISYFSNDGAKIALISTLHCKNWYWRRRKLIKKCRFLKKERKPHPQCGVNGWWKTKINLNLRSSGSDSGLGGNLSELEPRLQRIAATPPAGELSHLFSSWSRKCFCD